MKNIFSLFASIMLIISVLGCGVIERFKTKDQTPANVSPSASPTIAQTETPTPTATATPTEKAALGKNLLAATTGVAIAQVSSDSAATGDGVRNLIDEAEFAGWKTAEGAVENQFVVLEFPARTTLKTLIFDTDNLAFAPVAPKDIKVEISDVSAADGFQTILETTLAADKDLNGVDKQSFDIAQPVTGRFLRYTVKNNYGSPKAIFTKEIRGYGEQESIPTLTNVTGKYTFESGNFFGGTDIYLKQDGTTVIGCDGRGEYIILFSGGIDGRVATFRYGYAADDPAKEKDSGVMVFSPDGQKINFYFWSGAKKSYDTMSLGSKKSEQLTGACPGTPGFDDKSSGGDAIKKQIADAIEKTGRAVLYGINFDFNSDVIKAESKPTLDKVVTILKENADWKMQIEGHTDNVGGESFNQNLSEKRAASVVKYLTENGIEAGRLSSNGAGLSKPVSDNSTESGRAQNRRVELVKQ